jgi:Subtilase family
MKGDQTTLRWVLRSTGRVSNVTWKDFLDSSTPVDPYLIWADLTRLAGFKREDPDQTWPVLVECTSDFANGGSLSGVQGLRCAQECVALGLLQIPAAYNSAPDQEKDPPKYPRRFSARVSPPALKQLLADRYVARVQLGIPRLRDQSTTRPKFESFPQAGETAQVVIGVIDDGCGFAHPELSYPVFSGALAGRPRVHYLWDQDSLREPKPEDRWRTPDALGYGAELDHAALTDAANRCRSDEQEMAGYLHVDYVPSRAYPGVNALQSGRAGRTVAPMLSSTHGHGVAVLAGGNTDPLVDQRAVHLDPAPSSPSENANEVTFPLVFVQLPTRTVLDTSGGSLGVHVLDAAYYIIDRARRIPYIAAKDPKQTRFADNNVVINISVGSVGGSHDGSSILELALADLCARDQRLAIVVAAGNAHGSRTQARAQLVCNGSAEFRWSVGPDNPHESFLEIWLPSVDATGHSMHEHDWRRISLTITPPGGRPIEEVRLGQAYWLTASAAPSAAPAREKEPYRAAVIYARRVVQGLYGTMVLVAVAPTREPEQALDETAHGLGLHGDWGVELHWREDGSQERRACIVYAWAERSDLLYGNRRPQQSTVVSSAAVPVLTDAMPEVREAERMADRVWLWHDPPDPHVPAPSFGSVAGAAVFHDGELFGPERSSTYLNGVLASVGGYRLADGEMAAYSSGGPSRSSEKELDKADDRPTKLVSKDAPDIDAPSDISTSLPGLRVPAWMAGSTARLGGTSAAAALVTRNFAHTLWRRIRKRPHPAVGADEISQPRRTLTPTMDDRYRKGRRRVR